MAGPGLQQVQRLSLQQILAPQLQQSLHLLQVPTLELNALVHEELQQNPLLEEVSKDEPRVEVEGGDADLAPAEAQTDEQFDREFAVLAKLDDEWREYFAQTNSFRGRSAEQEEQRQHFFDSIVEQESLQHHLLDQIKFADISTAERKAAELIVGNINDDGYLLTPIEELAISSGLLLDELQKAVETVQTLHPVGVGARNLKECLLIQLDRLGKSESIEAVVVNQHLEDLGRKRFPDIARTLGISVEEVQEISNFISTLEPKPGRMFSPEQQQYVAADVVVQMMDGDANNMAQGAWEHAEEWAGLDKVRKGLADDVAHLMHEATLYEVHPDNFARFRPGMNIHKTENEIAALSQSAQRLRAQGNLSAIQQAEIKELESQAKKLRKAVEHEKARRAANIRLRNEWATLPSQARNVFQNIREQYARHTELMRDALIQRIERSLQMDSKSKRALQDKIRIEFESNIYRIFCCFDEGNIIVLFNGFQKKSQKTPQTEIEKAIKIKKEYFEEKTKNKSHENNNKNK
jgi:hypothetical protein